MFRIEKQSGFQALAEDAIDQERFRSKREEQMFEFGIVGGNWFGSGTITPVNPSAALDLDRPEQVRDVHHNIDRQALGYDRR